jgi:hypothetical protein
LSETKTRISEFVRYAGTLDGYERGEAQVFCDRLFKAFGHGGYKEAGATLEYKLKRTGKSISFPDVLWSPRLLIEMKSRGEKLQKHFQQAFDYWLNAVPDRPRFVVLCNFDEFWIYDFSVQLYEPMERVPVVDLVDRYEAFNFLFPEDRAPIFNNNRVDVTRKAADRVAQVFNSLVKRGEDRNRAQRFVLQCVVAMFSEDFDLLPKAFFTELILDCTRGASTYDLIGGLFRQMDSKHPASGGRFKGVSYFNGGLFSTVEPIELNKGELEFLAAAASEKWNKVEPPIFGTLFQSSMGKQERHAFGAHFTSEPDIQKVVRPTIVRPWREKILQANKLTELRDLADALLQFRVLDPACGSGNFLYIAYRELLNLEMEILGKIHDQFGERARKAVGTASLVSTRQFFGIDRDPFAVELAKVTLMLAKRIALAETHDNWFAENNGLPLEFEKPLPLDNLDDNIRQGDALFDDWPRVDAIIGNPPYQSKNKMQREYGPAYINRVRDRYPGVPGKADYCVYWFRRTHDELISGGRAGLVGTNTIRQNSSREGGLDYIVQTGGTITEATSTQVWSGDADVHVSIVDWVKGEEAGLKKLFRQNGDRIDSPWEVNEVERIGAALSGKFDVTAAATLRVNRDSDTCDQGQTHGHMGFVLAPDEAEAFLDLDMRNADVIKPYLIGDDFLSENPPRATRYVIDFGSRGLLEAQSFPALFERIQLNVLPDREEAAREEKERNDLARSENPRARVNWHHKGFLRRWWQLSYRREDLMSHLATMQRFISCSRVTKRPIFVFVSTAIHPNDAVPVFKFQDDYSFGILQSGIHWNWFTERCSTLTERFRYTSDTVYDSFPWPQSPTIGQVKSVAAAARELRALRSDSLGKHQLTLRELYRAMELPGENPLKDAHAKLDAAVRRAYGMSPKVGILEFLFTLNQTIAQREGAMQPVTPPGIPPSVKDATVLISEDCIPATTAAGSRVHRGRRASRSRSTNLLQ